MNPSLKVLIIEDEPLTVDSYLTALKTVSVNIGILFDVKIAHNCDDAISEINKAKTKDRIDIALLDIRLPRSKKGNFLCGEDLGIKLKRVFGHIKIIVLTGHGNPYRTSSIMKNLNPDGLLIKSDLTMEVLIDSIKTVVSGSTKYSQTVIQNFRKQSTHDFFVDNIDRKLLFELSKGTKMSELPSVIPLCSTALDRRKRLMKEIFNITDKGDRGLLEFAREKGFI
ncbi:response regulator [Seonamhaeicola aphaedonensis]|uniref:Response regulator receiver domain-containing protein n=1 Tax=Seonamhaeicola aphaedonensis TaxID=1461338 RepID=A0A3D9H835_9FLAO|nr:response regulator transcription factor [Seonamhaeicola aphaedonensis]RED45655.1 response regulator receiver domain-containing protein [Seonamhaeicola aphaedonensis]